MSESKEQVLRIIELRAENFMRLKAVRIRPDGTLVRIEGRNGAGKSAVYIEDGEVVEEQS